MISSGCAQKLAIASRIILRMSRRSGRVDSKSVVLKRSGGSNPPSAISLVSASRDEKRRSEAEG